MYEHTHFPRLEPSHLRAPRLFADRQDLMAHLVLPNAPAIAEIGVAQGDFTDFLLRTFQPARFLAADLFNLHEHEFVWGQSTRELLQGKSHREFFEDRFRARNCQLEILVGDTSETLPMVADASLDLVYVDAGHLYADVRRDALAAARMAKPEGLIVFNDYIMIDHHYVTPYGVVQAVNELVVNSDWRVVAFALQQQLFCDIALCRTTPVWTL